MLDETLDEDEVLDNNKVDFSLLNRDEIFESLGELQIPFKNKTLVEVLHFLFDRLLYEYMEDQSYHNEESYTKFKNSLIYNQLQLLIYNVKFLILEMYNNDIDQIPNNCIRTYRKTEINPIRDTNYLSTYEKYKKNIQLLSPYSIPEFFNRLVGLRHFSVRTKAIYHAIVEELELRDINYDIMLCGKERMLSYEIDIVTKDCELTVIKK